MSLGSKVGGFFLSTLESFPELFGIEPSQATQEFRAVAPVSGFLSQAAGAFVPYMGAARLARAAPLTGRFIRGAEALAGETRPIARAALSLGAEAAVVEAGRVGLAATGVPESIYEAATGRDAETRSLPTLIGEGAFNIAGSAALGGVGGAIMDRLRRGVRIQDIIPEANPDRPLVQQIRAMNDWVARAKDPVDPFNPDPAVLRRVEMDLASRVKLNLGDQLPRYTTDGMTIPSGQYRSQQGRLFRPIIGERRNRGGDGFTSSFLNRLSRWNSTSPDKLTETRRLIYSPDGKGAFASPETLDELMGKIAPAMDRDTFGMYALDARVVRVRSGQGNQPRPNTSGPFAGSAMQTPVYHGTSRSFEQFELDPKAMGMGGNLGRGVYFHKNPTQIGAYVGADGGNIRPSYVNIKNPYIWDGKGSTPYMQNLVKQGYDAIIWDDIVVVADPSQVRSAISPQRPTAWTWNGQPVERSYEVRLDDESAEYFLLEKVTIGGKTRWVPQDEIQQVAVNNQRLLSSEPRYSRSKNSAAQQRANGLERRFMHKSFADVGEGWRMAREADGLYVMVKKIEGDWGVPQPGDQYVFFRTDRPDVFAPRAARTNELLMRSAYLPQAAEDVMPINEPLWDSAIGYEKTYAEAPPQKQTKVRGGALGTLVRDSADTVAQYAGPTSPISYRNPTLARGVRLIKDLEAEVETRIGHLMDGARQFADKKSLVRSFLDLDAPATNGLRDFIKTLSKDELDTIRFVLETETPYEQLDEIYKSGMKAADGSPLISENVYNFFTGQQAISEAFLKRSKKLDGVIPQQGDAHNLLGEMQLRKGHYGLSQEFPGTIRYFLHDEHGDIVGLATGKSVGEAQAAAADIIEKQAKKGRVINLGGLMDETLMDSQRAQRLRAAVLKPGFLKNRGNLLGYDLQRGELTADRLAQLVEKNLRRRENWLKEVVLRERLAGPLAKLSREDEKAFQTLTDVLNRAHGNEGAFAAVQNAIVDKALHAVGFSGKDSASAIVRTTQSLLNSFQMAFGNITQPLLNGVGLFQTVFPEIAFVVHSTPELLSRYYVSVPLLDGAGNVRGTMGMLSEVKLMNQAFRRIGRSWDKQDPQFRELIEGLIADRSLSPRYAEEQFGANGAILKNATEGFKSTESFVKLVNSANEILLSKTEEINRLVSASAAYDLAMLKGLTPQQTRVFAREFLAKTAFNYGTVDRAKVFTTPLGSLMGTFKNWMFHYMANMIRYSTEGKAALPALFWQTASTALIGGAAATPLVMPIADAASKWLTDQTAMENVYNAMGPEGEFIADGLIYGLPGMMGLSFASQAASPGSDPERDAQMLFSFAAWDRIKSLSTATRDALTAYRITGESPWEDENVRREMVRALAPRTFYRAMSVAENTAVTSMATGYDVTRPMGLGGALMYAAGFNPTELEKTYEAYNLVRDRQEAKREMVREFGQTLAQAWENGDTRLANRVFARAMATGVDMSSVYRSAEARGKRGEETQLEFVSGPEEEERLPWAF